MDLVIFGIYQKINKCNLGTNCTLRPFLPLLRKATALYFCASL